MSTSESINDTYVISKLATVEGEEPIRGIAVDNHGTVYFTKEKEGLYRLKKGEIKPQRIVKDGSWMIGIVWDRNNTLYICDWNHKILSYSIDTGKISTLAGTEYGQKGHHPVRVTMDKNGDLLILEWHCIRKVNLQQGTVETIAGFGADQFGYKDGDSDKAKFYQPRGIACSSYNIYVCDSGNHCIRKIKNGKVTTVAGNPEKKVHKDGPLESAQFNYAKDLLLAKDGTLLVAENSLRRIDLTAGKVTTIPFEESPWSLGSDKEGNIYIGTMNALWKMTLVTESDLFASLNNITTWKHIRLFLVGDSGAGKTSLVRWLKGQVFNPLHVSTDSVDVSTADVNTWKSVTFDIKDYMADVIKNSKSPIVAARNENNITKTDKRDTKSEMNSTSTKQQDPNSSDNNNNVLQESKEAEDFKIPEELAKGILKKIKETQGLSQAFHVWDFAGQEEYYNTHHFFLSESAVYILVVDISKPVDIERIKFWLNSVKFYVTSAPIILVGTHSDQVTNANNIVSSLYLQLNDPSIKNHFAISCQKDSPDKFRKMLSSLAETEVPKKPCKLSWMLFYDEISKYDDGSSVTYLSLMQAEQMAAKFKMTESEVKDALRFFHENGYVLYYDEENLNYFIFPKPQQLVEVFKTVVTALGLKNKVTEDELSLLCAEGRMYPDTIRRIWREFDAELFRLFKVLLQKFGLAFWDPVQVEQAMECDLIIPCLVKTPSDSFKQQFHGTVVNVQCSIETIPPLGFANRLIAAIMSFTHIGGVSYCQIFQGGCIFTEGAITILITTAPGQVMIQTKKDPDMKATVGDLAAVVTQILDKVYSTARAHKKAAGIKTVAKCFVCFQENVMTDLQKDSIQLKTFSEDHFICHSCRGKYARQKIPSMLLPSLASQPRNSSQKRFTEVVNTQERWIQLCLILDTASNGWRSLGNTLGKNLQELDWIQTRSNPENTPTVLLLKEWQHRGDASADKFLKALREINNETAAELFEKWIQS